MDVFEAIHGRRSIRAYTSDPVPEEDLKRILEAAIAAPSAGNRQPWEFVVVRDQEQKRKLADAALGQSFIEEAPVAIVVCANFPRTARVYGERARRLYCIQDTAAAVQNIHLAAYALGYGTCWVGAFDDERVAEVIGCPKDRRPVAIIPIGKPAEKPSATPRLPLNKVVHHERF